MPGPTRPEPSEQPFTVLHPLGRAPVCQYADQIGSNTKRWGLPLVADRCFAHRVPLPAGEVRDPLANTVTHTEMHHGYG